MSNRTGAYVYYKDWPELAGAKTVPVSLSPRDFQPDLEAVEGAVNSRTKMLVVNSPHNPTGAVFSDHTLKEVGELAEDNDLLVVSDEIYEYLTYDGEEHISIASLPGMRKRVLTVNGFSKSYSMTGWRLGYVAGDAELIEPLLKVRQHTSNCPTSFSQYGALTALSNCKGEVDKMVEEFSRRRELTVRELNRLECFHVVNSKGAFYIFPQLEHIGMDGEEFADFLLERARVAVVPGDAFGEAGKGYIRIAYSTDYESLEEGLERIKKAVENLY